jgi:hypothetical protein
MTCSECVHFDDIIQYCWLHWKEVSEDGTCSCDDSIEDPIMSEDYPEEGK